MDVAAILMFALYAIFCVISGGCLIALGCCIFLAIRGNSALLLSANKPRSLSWKEKAFLLAAGVGFLVCMYQGAEAMLFWIPGSWGTVDEEGGYQTYRSSLAAVFGVMGGAVLLMVIVDAIGTSTALRAAAEELKWTRKIYAATSVAQLKTMESEFEEKMADLRASEPRSKGSEELISNEGVMLDAHRKLCRLVQERIKMLEMARG